MSHTKRNWIAGLVVTVLALVFLIAVLDSSVRSTSVEEPPREEFKPSGHFPDYCPPQWALDAAREYKRHRSQTFSQEFLDSFARFERYDGTEIWKIEARVFCIFQVNGLVFILFQDYEDTTGRPVYGRQELQSWLQENGMEVDVCQIIWSQCSQKPTEIPQGPEEEPEDQEGGRTFA